jgi:hypothetical protein
MKGKRVVDSDGLQLLDEGLNDVIRTVFTGLEDVKDSYLESMKENKKKFEKFISPGKTLKTDYPSFLSVLRRWNSYTPVLATINNHPKGGGYFVYHKGVGIVVDPGYNFLQNFFEQGFKLDDIDVVLITHAHNDHTVELESIFSLLFRRNKGKKLKFLKKIDLYLNLGTFKKFAGYFDLSYENSPSYISNIVLLDSHNEYRIPKDSFPSSEHGADITLYTTKTQHHEMITSSYALGFVLKCGDSILRFTADTGWNDKIEEDNMRFLNSRQIENIDILIPHLGSIKKEEFDFDYNKGIKDNIADKRFYRWHLGILGSICMIQQHKPDLVIFSEFGEELKDIRKDLIEKISTAMAIKCVPGDIGLHVKLHDLSIFCSVKGVFVPKDGIECFRLPDNMNDRIRYIAGTSFTIGQRADKQSFAQTLTVKLLAQCLKQGL